MTLILALPPEPENALSAEAARLQLPLREYALRLLALNRPSVPRPLSVKGVIRYWQEQGLLATRPDIADASEHARALRAQAERRERS
jgi:hypothetical protein